MKKTSIAVVLVWAACILAFTVTLTAKRKSAENQDAAISAQKNIAQAAARSSLSTSVCSFNFTSGAGDSFLKFCVTANGNITQIETPSGREHIAVGALGEGYGICDLNPFVSYSDYADFGDSGNWNPAVVLGQSTKSVKISRTTNDGVWTLTQTITEVSGNEPSIKILMALKNNTDVLRSVFLVRYADVDAAGSIVNNLDATAKSSFGWNSNTGALPFGLVLQNAGPFPVSTEPAGFTQNVPQGPDPCRFVDHFATGAQIGADGSIALLYPLNLSKGTSKSVTVSYKGF
jgi:hypothetical protein